MTTAIEALIEQRPHLKDPLELYARWLRFQREAEKFLPKQGSTKSVQDSQAYPRESVRPVFQLFASIFELPAGEFEPLCQALEEQTIDFMRFPLDQMPALTGLPCSQEELATILFLFSRPFFVALRHTFSFDGTQWENGRCPLCSGQTALTSIVEGPKRRLHCSFCGTYGPYRFIGCPNCGSVDAAKFNTIASDDEPGFRVITCDACRTYVKVMEGQVEKEMTVDLADMASLPLDIVAQDKGYARMAPNPISLKKMV